MRSFDTYGADLVSVIPPTGEISPQSRITLNARGKSPGQRNSSGTWGGYKWLSHEATCENVEQWEKDGANLGLKAARRPGVDIDSDDPVIADRIEQMALSQLGPAPVRGRANSSKRLLQYRTTEPFARMRLCAEREGEKHLVEILGDKQQYLIAGTHPSGATYEWDKDPTAQPGTEITREQASQFLDVAEADFAARGYTTHREGNGQVSAPAADQAALLAPGEGAARMEALRECIRCIPNSEARFPGRADYITFAYAVKAAAGIEYEEEGRELFYEWCARWEGGVNPPDTVEADWRSLHGPFQVGWAWLVDLARDFGFNSVKYEFAVVEGATPPAETARDAEAERWAAGASEGERLAAIIGSADRVFVSEVGRLSGQGVADRWELLSKAALQHDPLTPVFRPEVLHILRLSPYASERSVFDVALSTQLGRILQGLKEDDARLIRRAAWLLAAPVQMLVSEATAAPLSLWRAGDAKTVQREWLIDGALPRRGVGGLIGPPGNGKSWIVSAFACAVSLARGFAGSPVMKAGSVVCFATEDVDGFRERITRQLKEFGVEDADVFVIDGAPALSSIAGAIPYFRDTLAQLRARGAPEPVALVVDVLKGATTGEENNAQEMGVVMATLQSLSRMANAFVLVVHHSAVSDSGRARGSSVIEGAFDWEATVLKKDDNITMRVKKNKGGKSDTEFRWHLVAPGVLKEGVAPVLADDATIGARCAIAAGIAIRSIASPTHGVTKSELFTEMRAQQPGLFIRDGKTDRSRQTRALEAALRAGYVVEHRDKYRAGKEVPPAQAPESIEDLV